MGTHNLLIIENQQSQFNIIFDLLKNHYNNFPLKDEYIKFIDCVRVWINEEYNLEYRNLAFSYILSIIENSSNNISAILMDQILGGADHCLNGIDLAKEINIKLVEKKLNPIAVLFLSKTESNNKSILHKFIEYKKTYPNTNWIHKGYFGDEILEEGYFTKNVLPEIENLLSKSKTQIIIDRLMIKRPKIIGSSDDIDREITKMTDLIIEKLKYNKLDLSLIEPDLFNSLHETNYLSFLKRISTYEKL